MKKLLFLALIGTLVACGETTTSETKTDSAPMVVDSVSAPHVDSAMAVIDSASAVIDSAAHH